MITELARAKINLNLHVGPPRKDGYHPLDSLVMFADIGDVLEIQDARLTYLTATGPFAVAMGVGEDNLVLKAVRQLQEKFNLPDVHIHLEKNLPVAAGIGGGSADAAAALRAGARILDRPVRDFFKIAKSLGADVPVCLSAESQRMRGIGDKLEPAGRLGPFAAVLINPGKTVSTAEVFTAYDAMTPKALRGRADPVLDLDKSTNDLTDAATMLCPDIADVLFEFEQNPACFLARMSGSGATCFGLFRTDDQALRFADDVGGRHPDWWVAPCMLGSV